MNDAEKLRLLAEWFDMRDQQKCEDSDLGVQADLRKMADKIDTYGGTLQTRMRVVSAAFAENRRTEDAIRDATPTIKLKKNPNTRLTDIFDRQEDDFYNK